MKPSRAGWWETFPTRNRWSWIWYWRKLSRSVGYASTLYSATCVALAGCARASFLTVFVLKLFALFCFDAPFSPAFTFFLPFCTAGFCLVLSALFLASSGTTLMTDSSGSASLPAIPFCCADSWLADPLPFKILWKMPGKGAKLKRVELFWLGGQGDGAVWGAAWLCYNQGLHRLKIQLFLAVILILLMDLLKKFHSYRNLCQQTPQQSKDLALKYGLSLEQAKPKEGKQVH